MWVLISRIIGGIIVGIIAASKIERAEIRLPFLIIHLRPYPRKEWQFKLLYCTLVAVISMIVIPSYIYTTEHEANVTITGYPSYVYPKQLALVTVQWSGVSEYQQCGLECYYENAKYALTYQAESLPIWAEYGECVSEVQIPQDAIDCPEGRFGTKIRHVTKGVVCSDQTEKDVTMLLNARVLYPPPFESIVGYEVPVGGTAFGQLTASELWLLVQPSSTRTYYLQEGPLEISPDYWWSTTAVLGEPEQLLLEERFDIILVSADYYTSSQWEELIAESEPTGELPEILSLPPGAITLAQTTILATR